MITQLKRVIIITTTKAICLGIWVLFLYFKVKWIEKAILGYTEIFCKVKLSMKYVECLFVWNFMLFMWNLLLMASTILIINTFTSFDENKEILTEHGVINWLRNTTSLCTCNFYSFSDLIDFIKVFFISCWF